MTAPVQIPLDAIVPSFADILRGQGMPPNVFIKDKVRTLVETSLEILASDAHPCCISCNVSVSQFDEIFQGEGRNEQDAPLKAIYPQAEHLVLFALTMGADLSQRIEGFFRNSDFALGAMLDTVASLAVENTVGLLETRLARTLAGNQSNGSVTLNYSPGYCGWHLSAQKKVFQHLHPEQIGITLNDSCLMTPLKSTTGVLVHGDKTIHDFDNRFDFCRTCRDRTCVARRAALSPVIDSTR